MPLKKSVTAPTKISTTVHHSDDLLHPAAGADPPAPGTPQDKRGDKHQAEHEEAAVHDALLCGAILGLVLAPSHKTQAVPVANPPIPLDQS